MSKVDLPTFEAGGTTFAVVPVRLLADHGLLDDPAAERRRRLGRRLRRARQRVGLSQAALAELLGTSQPSVCAVEHGREHCSEARAAAWLEVCSSTTGRRKA